MHVSQNEFYKLVVGSHERQSVDMILLRAGSFEKDCLNGSPSKDNKI